MPHGPPSGPLASLRCASGALADDVRAALERAGFRLIDADEGPLDAAVHVAGAQGADPRDAGFAAALEQALTTAFLEVRSAADRIRQGGRGGAIVVVAPSMAGHPGYDALQQGLRLLVRSAALELGPEQIRVNIVLCPREVGLELTRGVADAAAFAVSARARFMTGADLLVDAGGSLR